MREIGKGFREKGEREKSQWPHLAFLDRKFLGRYVFRLSDTFAWCCVRDGGGNKEDLPFPASTAFFSVPPHLSPISPLLFMIDFLRVLEFSFSCHDFRLLILPYFSFYHILSSSQFYIFFLFTIFTK